MAVINRERLLNINPVEQITSAIKGLTRTDETKQIVSWDTIWHTGIPHEVIYGTAGAYFKYRAAIECPVNPEDCYAVRVWRQETRRDLLKQLNAAPESRIVYESLQQTSMFTIGPKETPVEKYHRVLSNLRGKLGL